MTPTTTSRTTTTITMMMVEPPPEVSPSSSDSEEICVTNGQQCHNGMHNTILKYDNDTNNAKTCYNPIESGAAAVPGT